MGLVGPRFGADRDFESWGLGVKIAVRHTVSKSRSAPNRGPLGGVGAKPGAGAGAGAKPGAGRNQASARCVHQHTTRAARMYSV